MKSPLLILFPALLVGPARADDSLNADEAGFRESVRPLLQRFCTDCHGPDASEGGVRLDTISADVVRGESTALWRDVLHRVETLEMPPKEADQPTDVERTRLSRWTRTELRKHITVQRGLPGRVVLRRLSRNEYRNTVRDLLGLDYDVGRSLPPDTTYHGFDHVGEVQELSREQLETYLQLARFAIDKALVSGDRPTSFQFRMQPELGKEGNEWRVVTHGVPANEEAATAFCNDYRPGRGEAKPVPNEWSRTYRFDFKQAVGKTGDVPKTETGVWLPAPRDAFATKGAAWGQLRFRLPPVPRGDRLYRLRVKAGALRKNDLGTPLLSVWLFKKHLGDFEITASADDPEWSEWVFAERDLHNVQIHSDDNRFAKTPVTDLVVHNGYEHAGEQRGHRGWIAPDDVELPGVFVDAIELETDYVRAWPPGSHTRLLFDSPNSDQPETYAREVLERFLTRAYRRPVRPEELESKLELFRAAYAETDDFVTSIEEPLVATLVSPQFLFLAEDSATDEKAHRPLDDHELASRLSYFLWSTMPDDELFDLANQGRLREPKVLKHQTDRLLDDPRAAAFHRGFTSQWLGLAKLDDVMIDDDRWVVRNGLRNAMREEPARFWATLLDEDHGLENLLASDFAVVNERLAQHYGLPGVYGQHFRKVPLEPGSGRGGLLTQAACMTITTDGMVTSPIYRGKWILEAVLDMPPPPAPANVPPLEDAPKERLSLREQFAKHREDANCAACHARIDPVGWPFERFSVLGEYSDLGWGPNWSAFHDPKRNKKGETPDLHGTLPDGIRVETVADVQRVLLAENTDDLLRSVTKNLLVYALGRPLDVTDDEAVTAIVERLKSRDNRARELVHAVVTSDAFLQK